MNEPTPDDEAAAAIEASIDQALALVKAESFIGGFDEAFIRDVLRVGFDAGVLSAAGGTPLEHGVEARTFVDGPFDRLHGPLPLAEAIYDVHLSNQLHQPVARLVERRRAGAWVTSAEQPEWTDPRTLERPGR